VEPGTIIPFAGPAVPAGYLACDGAEVAQAAYPALYAAIGLTWGVPGDPVNNFLLPDLAGRLVHGTGAIPTTAEVIALGESFGLVPTQLNYAQGFDGTVRGYEATAKDLMHPAAGVAWLIKT
jgi:microcystin-dependent protein